MPEMKAAMEVNTPVLKFSPITFDSLDAKIVQYKYAITKLEAVIKTIEMKINDSRSSNGVSELILVQYIIYLTSTVFAINESGFSPKLSALETFRAIKPSSIPISQVVTHVAYDFKDQPVVPLEALPSVKSSINCLNSLKHFCLICLDGYKKRQSNAFNEIKNETYMEDLDNLFKSSFFNYEADIDLSFKCLKLPEPHFVLPVIQNIDLEDFDHVEACLIDMDLRSLFELTLLMPSSLNRHKRLIAKYREIKQLPKHAQQTEFEKIPNSKYSLHRILFWALRFNDLYTIIRRFGRKIYLSNYDHLTDQKFLSFVPNLAHFRSNILREIDEFFNTAKKNGVLIATTTRFIRMNSKSNVDANTALEFVTFIQQSYTYVESMVEKLHEFGTSWLTGEVSFRNLHGLPLDNLTGLIDIFQKESARKASLKREKEIALQREKAKEKAKERAREELRQKVRNRAKEAVKEAEQLTKAVEFKQASESALPNHENEKTSSTLEIAKQNQSPTRVTARHEINKMNHMPTNAGETKSDSTLDKGSSSLTDVSRSSSLNSNNSLDKKALPRPLSMIFLGSNGSSGSLPQTTSNPVDKNKIVNTTSEGRRRSSSQPLSVSAAAKSLNLLSANSPSRLSQLRSPPATLTKSNSLVKKSTFAGNQSSPFIQKDVTPEMPEEGPERVQEKKLTANQKFQLHLREASRAGALYAQQKETFTNVVFDPNNPSSTKIRRQADGQKCEAPTVEPEKDDQTKENETKSGSAPTCKIQMAPTRSQVTKRNTKRNSVILNVEDLVPENSKPATFKSLQDQHDSESLASREKTPGKKVRFIGVPAYSAAEDAPSSQSSRILKNFAVPSMAPRQSAGIAFKTKDQQLKTEESFLFRQQLYSSTDSSTPPMASAYTRAPQTLRFSRFKSRF